MRSKFLEGSGFFGFVYDIIILEKDLSAGVNVEVNAHSHEMQEFFFPGKSILPTLPNGVLAV